MAKGKLSTRQIEILRFIGSFAEDRSYPPTIREIGEAAGISSTSVVNYNLNKLEREGYILRDLKVSRGVRLTDAGEHSAGLVSRRHGVAAVQTRCGRRTGARGGLHLRQRARDGRRRSSNLI